MLSVEVTALSGDTCADPGAQHRPRAGRDPPRAVAATVCSVVDAALREGSGTRAGIALGESL